jgi:hypothetical protein
MSLTSYKASLMSYKYIKTASAITSISTALSVARADAETVVRIV